MAGLRAMASELGFTNPRTYIASGNLVFEFESLNPRIKGTFGDSVVRLRRKTCRCRDVHRH